MKVVAVDTGEEKGPICIVELLSDGGAVLDRTDVRLDWEAIRGLTAEQVAVLVVEMAKRRLGSRQGDVVSALLGREFPV